MIVYGSVCSGIEAATCAWHPLGWKPAWFSQFDPEWNYTKRGPDFPSRVLAHHYPTVPNLGDMTKLIGNKLFDDTAIDLLVGGTPCQSFSVAGLRKGLDDERGNLSLEFVRLLMCKRPKWFIWENVPGVLSSQSGEEEPEEAESIATSSDFACIISAFTGRDVANQKFEKAGIIEGEFYSIGWRILDAQYFGVPQRRRRIFVVGHIGNDWRPLAAVLFERDSLRRDFTPSRETGQGTARPAESSIDGNSGKWWDGSDTASTVTTRTQDQYMPDKNNFQAVIQPNQKWPATQANTLDTKFGDKMGLDNQHSHADCPLFVPFTAGGFADNLQSHQSSTLKKNGHDLGGGSETLITSFGIQANTIDRKPENGGNGKGVKLEPAPTLTKLDRHAVGYSFMPSHYTRGFGATGIAQVTGTLKKEYNDNSPHVVYDTTQITSKENGSNPQPGAPSHPLTATGHVPLLISAMPQADTQSVSANQTTGFIGEVVAHARPPLAFKIRQGKEGGGKEALASDNKAFTVATHQDQTLFAGMMVRRLTPKECERLQGFPDDYTLIPKYTGTEYKDVPESTDSNRYQAIGNSMAVPVMYWLGQRIDMVDKIMKEVAHA